MPDSRRAMLERALRDVESRLQNEPRSIDLALERGALLEALGLNEMARFAYVGLLGSAPGHARTLNALGRLLYRTGARSAAQIAFAEAVEKHPDDPTSHVNLAYTLVFESKFEDARRHYEAALAIDPAHPMANQGLAYVLAELGDEEGAQRYRSAGFREPLWVGDYRGEGEPVRVLLLTSAIGGNMATAQFLDERIFQTTTLIVELFTEQMALPPHHLVLNAIGDADRCGPALAAAAAIAERTDAPMLNAPVVVLATGRARNAERLGEIPRVIAPHMHTLSRASAQAHGLGYPFLLRGPGFHTGRFFLKVENDAELEKSLKELPGDELLAIEFLNGRGADGKMRKYRVIIVGEQLYPLHLAIASDWKVHYGTAQMEMAEHRTEEERFLANMESVLGAQTLAALHAIRRTLALDYGGIDFGLDRAGNVLLYEANATMTVVVPEKHHAAYRRAPAERIVFATMKMLVDRAARV